MNIKSYDFLYLFFISIIVFVYTNYIGLNVDSAWILHCAQEVLNGATLYVDKTDVNPPLIFIYSMIVMLFSELTNISATNSYILFVLGISFVSIYLSLQVLKQIYEKNKVKIFFYSLLLILTIFTTSNFGEREHLFIIFVLPYIFLMTYRDKINVPKKLVIIISLFSIFGFNLKPHFLLLYLIIEIIYLLHKKSLLKLFRVENYIIISSAFFYFALIYFVFPEYLNITIPLAVETYSSVFNKPTVILISKLEILLFLLALTYWILFTEKKNSYKSKILISSITSLFIIYFMQQKGWAYHLLPLFILTQIFLLIIVFETKKNKIYFSLLIPICLSIPFFYPNINPLYPELKKHIQTLPEKSVVNIVTTDIAQGLSMLKDEQVWASRYSALFMIPSIILEKENQMKEYVLNTLYEDLLKYKPDYIIFQAPILHNFLIQEKKEIKEYYEKNYQQTKYKKYIILSKF